MVQIMNLAKLIKWKKENTFDQAKRFENTSTLNVIVLKIGIHWCLKTMNNILNAINFKLTWILWFTIRCE